MRALLRCGAGIALALAAAAPARSEPAACDRRLAGSFGKDVRVVLVRAFRQGEDIHLDGTPGGEIARHDLCLVKLVVGPGNPGPKDAPSTSEGIGLEIWLPALDAWNRRIHALGSGGFAGLPEISSPTDLGLAWNGISAADIANQEASVTAVTDGGHVGRGKGMAASLDGSFALGPDGKLNKPLWRDFASRAVHEMALKTKALVVAYYGSAAEAAYFEGCSTGGRQGLTAATFHPEDFDGILAGDASLSLTRLGLGELYPQIVIQRDLGGVPISAEQLNLVSAAAISTCDTDLDGEHEGYLSDPARCRYDPGRDPKVLCDSARGTCVTPAQALAIVKFWYGQTVDGSVPDPALANGFGNALAPGQLWFGVARGTALGNPPSPVGLARSANGVGAPISLATTLLAIVMENPRLAGSDFRNATSNGTDGWRSFSYADLASAQARGLARQSDLADINADSGDLRGFAKRGGKLLYYSGMADPVNPVQAYDAYYHLAARHAGGEAALGRFFRYFPVPGMGHCGGVGSVNGVAGISPPADPPLPAPGQLFQALTEWVENGRPPDRLEIANPAGTKTRPLCRFPQRLVHDGGDSKLAASYDCR